MRYSTVLCVAVLLLFLLAGGQALGQYCPECVDPSNNTCKPWAQGKARFQWASDSDLPADITLTAGPCGQSGETGRAYIFAYIDAHRLNCDSNYGTDPCGGDEANYDTFAIIRISGNRKAFEHIFPNGLKFVGNRILYAPQPYWAYTTVDKAGCNYKLLLTGPPEFKIGLDATVTQCQPEFDNSKFGINVTFYQTRSEEPDSFTMLARAKGSITVKANEKTDCDPINFRPDLRDGSQVAWIEETEWDYETGGDDEWMISYKLEGYDDSCSSTEGWLGPVYIYEPMDYLVPRDETFYRVKYPAYRKDINDRPGYAGMEGWSYDEVNKDIILGLGDLGKVYYHCDRKSGNRYMVSSIEHCGVDVAPGDGDTKWKFLYNGDDRLQYVYNGISVTDPNNPQTGTKYYSFEWDDNDPNVTYYNRKDTSSTWDLQRQWNLEFDTQDRAVKFSSICSSGCGSGSGQFEHIQYHDTFEDVIVKRFDAQGNTILENTIGEITYGQYEPAYWVWIDNYSFELNDVATGFCQSQLIPTGWTKTAGLLDDVSVCDPNNAAPHGTQVLRLTGDVTLKQQTFDVIWEDTKYLFEASVKSIPGMGTGTATIGICSTELGLSSPLVEMTYSASDGNWDRIGEVWDSVNYSGTSLDAEFIVTITGNNVEVDDIWLSAVAFVGNVTKPVVTQQKVYDQTSQQLMTAGQWTYDQDNCTVLEKKYVDGTDYMATKYEYEDDTFTELKKRIACDTLSDDLDNPTGTTYTTLYDPNDTFRAYAKYYPSGKRADVEFYGDNGLLTKSYVLDAVTDVNTISEEYEYINLGFDEEPRWEVKKQTSPRGGTTEYSYKRFGSVPNQTPDMLLESRKEPQTAAGQQETWYEYDGAQRIIKERKKDTDGNWVETRYEYDPETGFLNSVIADCYGIHAKTWYMHNDFGQVIRRFSPDNVVTGKSYGPGGELLSEFVISESSDPNDSDSQLTLISQVRYEYNSNGKLEKVKRAKDTDEFTYDNPDDWIVTKYEYDSQGRKTKVIEDYDDQSQRFNLTTTYEYDRQGRLEKTTWPTGRWVKTVRDGRGLVTYEITGYGTTDVYQAAYDYDANGNLIEQVNPDGTMLVYEYNNYDQLEKTYRYSTSGPYTLRKYDKAGSVIGEQAIDPNGVILQDVRKEYDILGNLYLERMVADPNNTDDAKDVISVYDYDVAGNLLKVIQKGIGSLDPNTTPETNDAVTEHFYDSRGRKHKTIDPEGIISDYYYSDAGQLLTIVDPNIPDPNQIFVTTHTYDAAGRLAKVVNAEGHCTVNSYNSLNQMVKQVVWDCSLTPDNPVDDVAVRQVRYEYNNLGSVTRQAVMEDSASTAAINTAVDMVTDSVFDTSTGLLDETKTYYGTTPTAAVTSYDYDEIGRNWWTTNPEGNETKTYYDSFNNVQVVKEERIERDPANSSNDYTVTVFYDYDDYGNLYRKTLDEDADGVRDATDPSTYYYYDALDRLEKQVGPDLVATLNEYDSFGNISQTIEDYDPSSQTAWNRTTEYIFDRLNRQAQVIAYDPNDTTTHIASQITSYEYNKRGQIQKIIYPDDSFVQYYYNGLRKVDEEVRRDGTSIYYWYDWLGNVITESDDEDIDFGSPTFVTEYEYDAAGNLSRSYKEESGVAVAESTFVYNGFGLSESETTTVYDLNARTTAYTYDGSGNILTQTHNGETITNTYDGMGRIETIDKGPDRIVDYYYIGTNTKMIDYPEADTTWEAYYDGLGRIDRCRSIDPNSDVMLDLIYTYDENSNRDSVKYNHLAVPVWDIYSYDNLQRLIEAEYGSSTGLAVLEELVGDVRFAANVATKWLASDEPFMELAQLQVRDVRQHQRQVHEALVDAGLDTVVRRYNDGEMPLVSLVEFGEDTSDKSTYEMLRDDSGELIGIVVTNSDGRITLFTLYPPTGETLVIIIGYDNKGNVISKTFTTYDEDGQRVEQIDMLAVEQQAAAPQSASVASTTSTLQESALDGGMTSMAMSAPVGPESTTEEFTYDHLGNRYQVTAKEGYTQTFTNNINNQYTHIHEEYGLGFTGDFYPEHDNNGNLKKDENGVQYSYDYRNRLTEIINVAQYGFDALGRRVKKYDDDKNLTTYFFYDPFGRVIAEYEEPDSGTDKFARSFVYGNGIDEVLAMFVAERSFDPNDLIELSAFCDTWLADSGDNNYDSNYDFDSSGIVDMNDFAVLADDYWSLPETEEKHFYYLKDALGSVIGIVGGKFQREEDREFYLYDVYGRASDTSDCGNAYFFTGRRLDIESGLYYFRFRTYDPYTGRMLQTDPMGYADGMSLYEYVMSNPTNWLDPWGLATKIEEDLTPEQLIDLLTNPDGKDPEKICNDDTLCYVSDFLKFREGRRALYSFVQSGGPRALERDAMGMTGVDVANALANAYEDDGRLMLGWPVTAGEVREPYKRSCYVDNCELRFREFVVDMVIEAVSQAITAGAAKGATLLLKTMQALSPAIGTGGSTFATMAGRMGPTGPASCTDDLLRALQTYGDDLLKDTRPLFGPASNVPRTNGQLVPEIGRRAEAWGVRKGLGNGPVAGTLKHGYADDLLTRYQQMFGQRGLKTEVRYFNGSLWERGVDPVKGSIRLDVVENPWNPTWVWDYKFGNSQLTPARINQMRTGAGLGPSVPITEMKP